MRTEVIFGILTSISLGLAGFVLNWQFDSNAKIEVLIANQSRLQEKIDDLSKELEKIAGNTKDNDRQDRTDRMFWKYTGWLHDQINVLRHKEGLEPLSTPPLE